jgi:pteridine reductase
MMQTNPLELKVALVTGAARRIGAEIASTLHAAGMNIVLHYHRSCEEAERLCAALNAKRADSAFTCPADLNQHLERERLVKEAANKWQRLDVLVNNASRFYRSFIGEVTEFAWDDLLNSNLKAPFFLSQAAAPKLSETSGLILNIIDIHADKPLRDYSVYCISKCGLQMLTKSLAKELGPKVRVNAIAPGMMIWPEGENNLSAAEKQKIIAQTALGRVGRAEDIAKAALFFVRDADFITGQILDVDGGRL